MPGKIVNTGKIISTSIKPETNFRKMLYRNRFLFLMILPCFLYYAIFKYLPIWGIMISFKNYKPFVGFSGSEWVGLKWFIQFFSIPDTFEIIRNTFLLGVYSLFWGFPAPIIFALVLNEIRNMTAKRIIQTVTYMPHFLSMVVVTGMILEFLSPVAGPVNELIDVIFGYKINFRVESQWFRTIYVASDIWQNLGWGAIIYLAALSGIDPSLYESAMIDGANKFKQIIHVTLPMISPTIIVLLLLRVGNLLDVGFEKVFLLYNPAIYGTADVISTYVYRVGITNYELSYASAIGTLNSIVNMTILVIANFASRRINKTSLW
jgi:putative aldouronate transport system permease protein